MYSQPFQYDSNDERGLLANVCRHAPYVLLRGLADGLDGRSSVTQIGLFSLTWQLSKSKSYNRANFQFSAIKVNIYFAESRN